jgi:hypothetical protein
MLQAAPQFTPFQLLEAARRAEADGHIEAAFQFYRRTADQFAYSPQAAEAREGLARLHGGWQPKIWHLNGAPHPSEAGGRAAMTGRKARRSKNPPAARQHYSLGRWLARLVSLLGWTVLAGGAGVPTLSVMLGRPELGIGSTGLMGLGGGLALLGLLLVALGLAFRALFDQANATRELVAIERLKAGLE